MRSDRETPATARSGRAHHGVTRTDRTREWSEGPSAVAGRLIGVLTTIGTIVGGVVYAVLWNAYSNFYAAFGLAPEDIGLSRERLLLPAIVTAIVVPGFLVILALGWLLGYLVIPVKLRVTRSEGPALIAFSASTALIGMFIVVGHHGEIISGGLSLALLITWFFLWGVLVGALRLIWRPVLRSLKTPHESLAQDLKQVILIVIGPAVLLSYLGLVNLLIGWLTSQNLLWILQMAIVSVPGAATLALVLTRWRWWWADRSWEGHDDAQEAGLGRSPFRAVLIGLLVAALLGVWVALQAVRWSASQYDAGIRAIELGYYESGRWLKVDIRAIVVQPLDPRLDPLQVCGPPSYAASLIAPKEDGWWVLLRADPEDETAGYAVRVIWLPRDTYGIDLAPIVFQPSEPGSPEPETSDGDPQPWRLPACID